MFYVRKEVIKIIENKDYELWNGDCLEMIKQVPNESVDLILTDPPYENIIEEDWDKKGNNPFDSKLCKEFYRILKPTGSVYIWCGIGEKSRSLLKFIPILDKEFYFKDLITWKKKKGIGMRKGWLYTREECLWYVKDNKQFFWNKENQYSEEKRQTSNKNKCVPKSEYKRITNVWDDISEETCGNTKNKEKLHPCIKPVRLMERIIRVSTVEEQVVLDCFMGSGSVGVAALNLHRKFIGIELDEKYFNIAKERIDKA